MNSYLIGKTKMVWPSNKLTGTATSTAAVFEIKFLCVNITPLGLPAEHKEFRDFTFYSTG